MISRPEQSELRLVGERKSAIGQHHKSVCAVKAKINKSTQNPNKTKMLISWAGLIQATHFAEFTKFLQIHPTRARPSPCSPGASRAPGGRRDQRRAVSPFPSRSGRGISSKASWRPRMGSSLPAASVSPWREQHIFSWCAYPQECQMEAGTDQGLWGRAAFLEKAYSG